MRFVIRLVMLMLLELPFAACSQGAGRVPRTVRVDDIGYSARVRIVPDSSAPADPGLPASQPLTRVQAAVTVTNLGRQPVALGRWPNCFFTILELWPATGGRVPAWDEKLWRAAYEQATGVIVECDYAGELPERELVPGASVTLERQASSPWVRDVLGDSLAGGRYRAVLRVRPQAAPRDAPPSIRLAAGEVVLRQHATTRGAPPR